MSRKDKKETYRICCELDENRFYDVTFKTTQVVMDKWIKQELERRDGTVSSWLSEIPQDEALRFIEESSHDKAMNKIRHVIDILDELEIDFDTNLKGGN